MVGVARGPSPCGLRYSGATSVFQIGRQYFGILGSGFLVGMLTVAIALIGSSTVYILLSGRVPDVEAAYAKAIDHHGRDHHLPFVA